MTASPPDPESETSADDLDLGWGGREWADGTEEGNGAGGHEDADLERLRADRPPHHEERER